MNRMNHLWTARGLARWIAGWARLCSRAALVALVSGSCAWAQTPAPAPTPIETFFQHPSILAARLSPSGRQIAVTTARGGGRVSLLVIDLGEGLKRQWAARLRDLDVVQFEWVSDERLVFSLVDLSAGSGSDFYSGGGLFSVKPDGSDFQTLIRRDFTPIDDPRDRSLPPTHMLLHIPSRSATGRVEEVIVGRYDRDGTVTPIALHVGTGRTRSLDLVGAPDHARRWLFDSSGRAMAVTTASGARQALWARDPGSGQWTRLRDEAALEASMGLHAVGEDGTLYVTHPEGAAGYAVLSRLDFRTRAPETPPMVRTPGFDFEGRVILQAGTPLGVRLTTDAETTVWFDGAMKAFQAEADQRLPGRINRITCRRCGTPQMRALVFSYSDQDPGQYWLHDAQTKSWQPVAAVMDGIQPARMAQVDFHRFKARDGREIPVWVTRPAGLKRGEKPPAVVMVHGGPWVRGGNWSWNAWEQFLASRGYVVISPEFRGSTGYGQDHFRAGWKQWGQAMQDDVADALLWARASGMAGDRACIAGASYGGYSALMGLARHPELYRCGVAWVAVTDLMLLLQGSWRMLDDVNPQARRHGLPAMVGDVKADEAMLKAHSPVEQAHRIKAPLLMGFGEQDLRVPLAHGQRMREALQSHGHEPQWVSYANEGHSWRQVKTQVDFATRMERFLAEHLRQAPRQD